MNYRLRDYWHFLQIQRRNKRRQRLWAKDYEHAVRTQSFRLPHAAVVQLLPTEACNLRCAMCNQWGENGYFLKGIRQVAHMDVAGLTTLLRGLSPERTLISVHGGEPFAYKHTRDLLRLLAEGRFDVMFSTNGTLLDDYLSELADIENLMFLFSIDGDEATHDRIRGPGTFATAKASLAKLFALRRSRSQPLPLVLMNFVVCEFTTTAIEAAYDVACDLGVLGINYNLRWFLTEAIGQAYERHLEQHFGRKSSGAWLGWVSDQSQVDYAPAQEALRQVIRRNRFRMKPPFITTLPKNLKGNDVVNYYADYLNVFGNDSCFMPFYWARIHANGDLIYCPGHPDLIVGNVFRDGFEPAFNSPESIRFRQHILTNRLPICNRCCGLYMTHPARGQEQQARQRLGLSRTVTTHWPVGS